jgi:hypothetical protein
MNKTFYLIEPMNPFSEIGEIVSYIKRLKKLPQNSEVLNAIS